MHLNAENDRSHSAVLTAIVRVICSSLTNVGKASFNKQTSLSTSFMLSISLFCKVRLASVHSIFSLNSCMIQLMEADNQSQEIVKMKDCNIVLPSLDQYF